MIFTHNFNHNFDQNFHPYFNPKILKIFLNQQIHYQMVKSLYYHIKLIFNNFHLNYHKKPQK